MCRFSLYKIINQFNLQNFDLGCIISYKTFSLLKTLKFIIPLYPQFGAISSFANSWLGSLQTAKQQLEIERKFSMSPFNEFDALFDPEYDFCQDFQAQPAELINEINERIVTDLVWELRRILMRQEKAGRIAIEKCNVFYEIDGFKGEIYWYADFNEIDQIKIFFEPMRAIPNENWLKNFAESVQITLSDKNGEDDQLFQEIKNRIYQSVIKKQVAKITSVNIPTNINEEMFIFTTQNALTEDQIKLRLETVVYAICYKFNKNGKQKLRQIAKENGGVFASESNHFANLEYIKQTQTGVSRIALSSLKLSKGPSDYLIFEFKQNYDYPWSLQCGKYLISYQEEQFYPENVITQVYNDLANKQRSFFLQDLQVFLQNNVNNDYKLEVYESNKENQVFLTFRQLQLLVKDQNNFNLCNLLTGDTYYSTINSLINGGLIKMSVHKENLDIEKLIQFALNDFKQLKKVLILITFVDKILINIPEDTVYKIFFENIIGETINSYDAALFYQNELDEIHAIFYVNDNGVPIANDYYLEYDQNDHMIIHLSKNKIQAPLQVLFKEYSLFSVNQEFIILENQQVKITLLVQQSNENIKITFSFDSNQVKQTYIIYNQLFIYSHLQCSVLLIQNLIQNLLLQQDLLNKRMQSVYFNFVAIPCQQQQQQQSQQEKFDTRFYSPYNLVDYLQNFNLVKWVPVALNKDILLQNIEKLPEFNKYYQAYCLVNRDSQISIFLTSTLQIHFPSQKTQIKLLDSPDFDALVQERRYLVQNKLVDFSSQINLIQTNSLELLTQQDDILLFIQFTGKNLLCQTQISSKLEFLAFAIQKQIQSYINKPKIVTQDLKNQFLKIEQLMYYKQYHNNVINNLKCPTYAFSRPLKYSFKADNFHNSMNQLFQFQSARQMAIQLLLVKQYSNIKQLASFLHAVSKTSSQTEIFSLNNNIFETYDSEVELMYTQNQTGMFLCENKYIYNNMLRLYNIYKFKDKTPIFCLINKEVKEPKYDGKSLRFNINSNNGWQFTIDLGGCKDCIFNLQFDSPSLEVDLVNQFEFNNQQITLKKQFIRQYSQSYFFSSNSELIKFVSFKYFLESAETRFFCNEKYQKCSSTEKSSQQEGAIVHWQNQCRCGGHHVTPFGHRSVILPTYKNSKQFILDCQKAISTANLLNILNCMVEVFGDRKVANMERDHSLINVKPEIAGGCITLKIRDCQGVKIVNGGLKLLDRDVNVWDLAQHIIGIDGIVFGIRFYGWAGERKQLLEKHWIDVDE
eukprot:EST45749.1 Hypothetical protein SS50377_14320 [Spironucleus salmonicida]